MAAEDRLVQWIKEEVEKAKIAKVELQDGTWIINESNQKAEFFVEAHFELEDWSARRTVQFATFVIDENNNLSLTKVLVNLLGIGAELKPASIPEFKKRIINQTRLVYLTSFTPPEKPKICEKCGRFVTDHSKRCDNKRHPKEDDTFSAFTF
jgi:hypothetical protein